MDQATIEDLLPESFWKIHQVVSKIIEDNNISQDVNLSAKNEELIINLNFKEAELKAKDQVIEKLSAEMEELAAINCLLDNQLKSIK